MTTRNALAFEIPDDQQADGKLPAGAYYFMRDGKTGECIGIIHACPCGCGAKGAMWFKGKADAGGPEWDVTGEWPKATMRPSIGFGMDTATGKFHWHGFLNNGVFEEC